MSSWQCLSFQPVSLQSMHQTHPSTMSIPSFASSKREMDMHAKGTVSCSTSRGRYFVLSNHKYSHREPFKETLLTHLRVNRYQAPSLIISGIQGAQNVLYTIVGHDHLLCFKYIISHCWYCLLSMCDFYTLLVDSGW